MDTDVLKNKNTNRLAIWAITPNGRTVGLKIQKEISEAVLFLSDKNAGNNIALQNILRFENLGSEIAQQFNNFSGHVFIFSTGIAIRMIAPFLKSKTSDPAVVVVDDNGHHAISLLSGHIGGANHLTHTIASILGARPVITTATDINQRPSIDMVAQKAGLFIETPQNIKHINMAFLMNKKIRLYDPLGRVKPFLADSFWEDKEDHGLQKSPGDKTEDLAGNIFCSYKIDPVSRETFILRPLVLSVGIGCNRGTSMETIKAFLELTFNKAGFSKHSILKIASADIKKDEGGLLAMANEMQIAIDFYNTDQLRSVTTLQTPSKMVEKHLGVKGVCEAAAILSAKNGILILPKQKNKDVTIAVAILK